MSKRIGSACILLGVICLLCAFGLLVYNSWEDKNVAVVSQALLEDVQSIIAENKSNNFNNSDNKTQDSTQDSTQDLTQDITQEITQDDLQDETLAVPTEMKTVRVGEYDCIGILTIPALEVELPVLTDWSYVKLKKAPCLYYGSYYEKDFVIAAHNYNTHFGRLSELQAGDIVIFTDVNGVEYYYEVVLLETLPKEATKEMIASGFDLSLYTCTPGGANRVTVRCRTAQVN